MSGAPLGHGPLVVSMLAPSLEAFGRALEGAAAAQADVIELRLDSVAEAVVRDPAALRALVARIDRPTIAAIHGAEGFGSFAGDARARGEVLRTAESAGVNFVDVDERFAAEVGDPRCRRIVSTHRTALDQLGLDALARKLDAVARPGRDLVKVVPAASTAEEGAGVLQWLAGRAEDTTIAFASGEAGTFTRLLAPAFGSALVYAAPDPDPAAYLALAAPGQLTASRLRSIWPGHAPTRSTQLAAVCGRPIHHSASPVVHGAAARAAGLDAMLVPVAPEELRGIGIDGAAPLGPAWAVRWLGLSVTAPFKADAVDWAHEVAADAEAMGAANTLVPAGAGLAAFNTDAPAVELALREAGARFDGVEALVVGAGGAARAAVHALRSAGARVTCAARRLFAAQCVGAHAAVALGDPAYGELRPGIIVHTTPLGTDDVGEAPVPDGMLRAGVFVLDAVYRPRRTSLLRRAAAAGATPVAGSEWFLGQAWLQHLRIFREAYRGAHGDPVPDAATAAAVRAAMAGALDGWLGSPSPGGAESKGSTDSKGSKGT